VGFVRSARTPDPRYSKRDHDHARRLAPATESFALYRHKDSGKKHLRVRTLGPEDRPRLLARNRLITGHRFEAKRDINGDDIGVLTIQLRDDKAVAIRPQAIIAVTFLEQLETPAEAEGSPTPAA
jgi:hypothetical protein